ncbi:MULTISPECIES: subclass B3 metallo-beta-lactamase [unclassified Janthinobacterium]|uniref:subclass B3 metallo-beta-lactamase n=1 Tax=unclassified Janthinobacterium TaxID=2610881 RepID=UPI001E5262C4|nr:MULTISPECIES: subclass B3 metallo-beta-lactamase [unclassified Janthinobacterium]MCC7644011.1 subclass B3 metallo-beta-lactamase [Janthinobacterium sp. EB271-G4-3-1]MCC7692104.1 subclass B3 metallo-beta-lactamase [Janthinobacterium sp. EB271-G4-3-2]
MPLTPPRALILALLLASSAAQAQAPATPPTPTPGCDVCAAWNADQTPFRIFGNTYYVGVKGLSSVLITSPQGHVLIDGGLPESAPKIIANIAALGFRIEDVKLILNSHGHIDHAGGLAELQRRSDALVAASPSAALDLASGEVGPDDPQYHALPKYPPVKDMRLARDGGQFNVGPVTVTAHATPGHTPGGLSWTWQSCDGPRCRNMVYADSLNAVSRPGFKFSASSEYPNAVADLRHSFETLEKLPCDVLISAHPEASQLWERLEASATAGSEAFIDPQACRAYVAAARSVLESRLEQEKQQ